MRYTNQLQQQMQRVGLTNLRALCEAAEVSRGAVARLRQGKIGQMRLETVMRLSRALKLPLSDLVAQFSEASNLAPKAVLEVAAGTRVIEDLPPATGQTASAPDRLEQMQRTSLQVLEPWLLQWPTAAQAAQANPDIPAVRLLPLVAPVSRLVESWGVTTIGAVGQQVAYDPQRHQSMVGPLQTGDPVRIRYVGYRHHDKLLYRAKASPISE
ncbi:MAG: helix-turn-helix transcriptional regulator [Cyanobacteria bacterium P01_A01_bin.135]